MRISGGPTRRKVLLGLLGVAMVAIAPLVWTRWKYSPRKLEPLSAFLTVTRREYVSPAFVPARGKQYQIELYPLPARAPLDLDWKVVDDRDAVVASGKYRETTTAVNDAILCRDYQSEHQSAERIVLDFHNDEDFGTTLHVGLPDEGVGAGYALWFAEIWAALVVVIAVSGFLIQRVCTVLSR